MRPRVVHIITRLIAGGAQQNTLLSCQALRDRYDVTLITGPPDGEEGSLLEEAGRRKVPVRLVPELVRPVRPWQDAAAYRRLVGLLRDLRPDIVHTHSSKAGILGRAAAWRAGVPIRVHTNHGLPFHALQPWPLRAIFWTAERAAAALSHEIVCVGEEMKRQAIAARLAPVERFDVVYSGVETERFLFPGCARARLGIGPGVPVVGLVSRMAEHKGHRFLVDAAPRGAHLLFVGDGEQRPAIEAAVAARGLAATFTGHVPPAEIPDLLGAMDVLVLPSLWEGLPRAPVEALLAGRPVVAFDCDGAREVVIDGVTGRLVVPRDRQGLHDAIVDLLGRADRGRSLGEAGRRRFSERFDWRACAAKLDAIYRRLLTARTGRGLAARP